MHIPWAFRRKGVKTWVSYTYVILPVIRPVKRAVFFYLFYGELWRQILHFLLLLHTRLHSFSASESRLFTYMISQKTRPTEQFRGALSM
jgi:hypothetical protein